MASWGMVLIAPAAYSPLALTVQVALGGAGSVLPEPRGLPLQLPSSPDYFPSHVSGSCPGSIRIFILLVKLLPLTCCSQQCQKPAGPHTYGHSFSNSTAFPWYLADGHVRDLRNNFRFSKQLGEKSGVPLCVCHLGKKDNSVEYTHTHTAELCNTLVWRHPTAVKKAALPPQ